MNAPLARVSFPGTSMLETDVETRTPAGEMIAGQPVTFARVVRIEVVDAPAASAAQPDGANFVPDVPGVYTLLLVTESGPLEHRRVAFPLEALEHPIVVDARRLQGEPHWPAQLRDDVARRIVLRKIAAMARRSLHDSDGSQHGDAFIDPALFADGVFARLNKRRPIPVGFDIGSL